MDISLHDIAVAACEFGEHMLMSGTLSEGKIKQNAVAFSPADRTYVANLVVGALELYHRALRKSLLEKGIDIGDFAGAEDDPAR